MPKVWLIRHAQSESNAGRRTPDPVTIPLTALGRSQAEAVARLFDVAPTLIVESPYTRARQTAAPVRARFPRAPAETWPVQEITYLAPSRCHDTNYLERRPLVEDYWQRSDPHFVDGPGAESFAAFIARVDGALARLRAMSEGFVAVFTHGQVMQAAMWRLGWGPLVLTAERMAEARAFMDTQPVPNGAILELELGEGEPVVRGLHTAHGVTATF